MGVGTVAYVIGFSETISQSIQRYQPFSVRAEIWPTRNNDQLADYSANSAADYFIVDVR